MKKLISLLLAVVMVMGMATVAFAADPTDAGDHLITTAADIPTTVTLAAGETANYTLQGGGPKGDPVAEAAWAVYGKELKVTSDKDGKLWLVIGWYGVDLVNGEAQGIPDGGPMWGAITFAIENTGTETATYNLEWLGLPGTIGNPEDLDVQWGNQPVMQDDHAGDFYYTYTAGATAEVLTIKDVVLTYNAMNMKNVTFNIMMTRDDNYEVSLWSEGNEYADEIYMPLAAGQSVSVMVRAKENEATWNPPSVEFKASVAEAVEVDMAGTYTIQQGVTESWYAVNSMLAGYIVVVNGDDASLVVDGTVIEAVDGVATAVLNGEGAVIPVGVFNAVDMIILPAPVEINAAGDYEATIGAGAEAEYAINSKLAGAVLTVKGEGAYILVGTTKIEAVDGVATYTLDGEGATIAVKIGNSGTAAGEYDLTIAYPPTVITATGDYKATVGAGAEVEYAINSKLAGAVLTVKGEKAYIVMGDNKVTAVDGVATIVLDGKGATIAVKVGNVGTASAEYALNIDYPPVEITATGDYKETIGAGAEVEYVINSKLAGAVLTVKGEKAYIVMGDTKVTAVDGVATIVLDGKGATIAVKIGNAGTASAEYALNVAYLPTAITATGDYKETIGAGAEVEYAINSKLAGAVLTVKGEKAYIVMGDTKVTAVDGVASIVLDGEGATIAVKIGNAGTASAEYALNIAYAPESIIIAGDYTANVPAKGEVEFVVNSKLDGAVVTVKGEGAYLVVNGKKIEGKDGVVTATLKAEAATISLIVGNASDEAVQYTVNVAVPASNPATGDFGIIGAAVAMAISAIGGVAVVAKKKEF